MILTILTVIILAYKLTNFIFPERFLKYWSKELIQGEIKDVKTFGDLWNFISKDRIYQLVLISELLCLILLISLLFTKYALFACGIFLFRFIRDRVKAFYKDPFYTHDVRIDAVVFIIFAIFLLSL